ncbi:MAG TPA: RNA polymerase sigma factor [Candidatus Binataceae bacterium]|nr:RNA polymerase sigma factor [Candidatus Binataceae bacterium]
MELSDEELCRRIGRRDAQAFDLLVERYQARAYRLACSILGNEDDARDVSQDAFIRLYESAASFGARARFSTWFHRILVNLCIDHRRRNRWWRRLVPLAPADEPPIDPPSEEPGPEREAIGRQSIAGLRRLLANLSPKQRAAVLLQVQEELSSREIAEVLQCSENTVRVHVHRGLAELRKALKREQGAN